jgi:hypothetical protein
MLTSISEILSYLVLKLEAMSVSEVIYFNTRSGSQRLKILLNSVALKASRHANVNIFMFHPVA